jgi:hypothetical protein
MTRGINSVQAAPSGISVFLLVDENSRVTGQNTNRSWSWTIRGGSMFASAGRAFEAVPTATS